MDRPEMAKLLSGDGIELGAQDCPLDLSHSDNVTSIQQVDRYSVRDRLALFPELAGIASKMVEPDILCDITCGLMPFPDEGLDYIVACHIIEHLPDPLRMLEECWRALRFGGRLFLALPDKDYLGMDMRRPITSLEHVVDDHRKHIEHVEDHHLEEYLRLGEGLNIPAEPSQRQALFELHRNRSLHVHVWNHAAFSELLGWYNLHIHDVNGARDGLQRPFAMIASSAPVQNVRSESIFVLEKRRPGPA